MVTEKCKICGGQLSEFIKDIFDDRHGYPGRFDVSRCNECGFGQTIPEIPEEKIGEIYTKYYPRKNINIEVLKNQPFQIVSQIKRWRMVRWCLGINNTAHYHIKSGSKVLDIGCGDCTSIREINAMDSDAYGIEPDQNIKSIVDVLGLKVHIGLFNEVPFPDKYFNYITMSQVLEHVHNPIELLISFKRILKDNGQVIIGVPNIDSRLRKKYGHRWLNWHVPYHINHFSHKSLMLFAEKSGYRIRKIKTYTPNLWVELQKRLYNYPVREGIRVPFFNCESEQSPETENIITDRKTNYFTNRCWNRVKALFRKFHVIQIILLRVYDILGVGESYLVFLEKK